MHNNDKLPPLHARLYWYVLTAEELALLKAMVEHCSDGSVLWASIKRLSVYSKLSERTIQRMIHGWDNAKKKHIPGLVERKILQLVAKASTAKRRPATYRLIEAALKEDPKMRAYRDADRQRVLPGVKRIAVPGEPIRPSSEQLPPGVTVTPRDPSHLVSVCHQTGVTVTPDSKAFDSLSSKSSRDLKHPSRNNSKTVTHSGENAALSAEEHAAATMPAWLAIKEQLRSEIPSAEWDLWVQPARLLSMLSGNTMLIGVPAQAKIMAAAKARQGVLNEIAGRANLSAVLTRYPDEYEREEAKKRFGKEFLGGRPRAPNRMQ